MSKRGGELREHILYSAKNVFLELGFERTSMDVIALSAQTSKRTLYAHFESKENLYLAIVELVREIYLSKLKPPSVFSAEPEQALLMFCGKYLESLLFHWTVQMCRMMISEAERFPEGSKRYFDVIFTAPKDLLTEYVKDTFKLTESASSQVADRLLATVIEPRFSRALFGIDTALDEIDEVAFNAKFDLGPVRTAVKNVLNSLPEQVH